MSKDEFVLSAGQSHEIELAMNRLENGIWTPELVHRLYQGNTLGQVRQVLLGHAEICRIERLTPENAVTVGAEQHIINCSVLPFEPPGLTVAPDSDQLPNRVRGQFIFDPAKIKLHRSPNQKGGKYIKGEKLKKELESELVLTANVLDFYLANPNLIPEEWKERTNGYITCVFFWGTVYRDSYGSLFVRYLYFSDSRWYSDYSQLDHDWHGHNPSAERAS